MGTTNGHKPTNRVNHQFNSDQTTTPSSQMTPQQMPQQMPMDPSQMAMQMMLMQQQMMASMPTATFALNIVSQMAGMLYQQNLEKLTTEQGQVLRESLKISYTEEED